MCEKNDAFFSIFFAYLGFLLTSFLPALYVTHSTYRQYYNTGNTGTLSLFNNDSFAILISEKLSAEKNDLVDF